MSVPHFGHLAYAKTEPARHRFSLADSGIVPPDLAALGLPDRAPIPSDVAVLNDLARALGARVGAPTGRVIVTAGASEAIVAAYLGLADDGDEVLVESFGYEPHRLTPPALRIPMRTFSRSEGAASLAADVERARSPRTRIVMLSDLHNPSGATIPPDDLDALTRLAERHDLWMVCDETFRDATDRPLGTVASRSERWVSISTLTKVYGLGGLRIGWIAASPAALARCENAQNGLSANASLPAAAYALELMPQLDRLRARTHAILRENHARWRSLAGAHRGANPTPAGTTTWFRFDPDGAGDAFSAFASGRFDLAVTPGRYFGDPRGVRVGLGGEPATFAAALREFERALLAFDPTSAVILEENA